MVGLGYHVYKSSETIRLSDTKVAHTQKIIREVQGVINAITDVINQQRRIVTNQGDKEAYTNAKSVLTTKIAIVRDLTKENSIQTSRITEVEYLSLRFKNELDTTISKFDEPAIVPSLTDYDEIIRVRDDMLKLLNNILSEEYKLLSLREAQVTKTITKYKISLMVGGIMASLIILIFNWYLLKAQLEVTRAEVNMRESEERLRLAIRGSNDGIFDWNFKTKEIYWSKQYKQILGYDEDEISGNEETFRRLLHPDDAAMFWEAFNNYINGRMSEFSCIFRMMHKSGRVVWIHGRGKAIFDENGHAQRFIGAHTDITYLKEHERQLKEERDRAEAASVAKGEFLAHMSHEIRTPLTAVSGIAEILNQAPEGFSDTQKK
jgi:PAS domain S-box-containing protein